VMTRPRDVELMLKPSGHAPESVGATYTVLRSHKNREYLVKRCRTRGLAYIQYPRYLALPLVKEPDRHDTIRTHTTTPFTTRLPPSLLFLVNYSLSFGIPQPFYTSPLPFIHYHLIIKTRHSTSVYLHCDDQQTIIS
jgi:hypothetical protein